MRNSAVLSQLKEIIVKDLDINFTEEEIDENTPLFEGGLGIDSIAIVELISAVEERFCFQFSDSELHPDIFENLKSLTSFICEKLPQ